MDEILVVALVQAPKLAGLPLALGGIQPWHKYLRANRSIRGPKPSKKVRVDKVSDLVGV